jgi:hypothetical protein
LKRLFLLACFLTRAAFGQIIIPDVHMLSPEPHASNATSLSVSYSVLSTPTTRLQPSQLFVTTIGQALQGQGGARVQTLTGHTAVHLRGFFGNAMQNTLLLLNGMPWPQRA